MTRKISKTPLTLIVSIYRRIFPIVNNELAFWQTRAKEIPNPELRTQALASMKDKRFHCLGGSVYALLAGYRWRDAIRFIVAYQTISDYLDNLCDRSTSNDPADFRMLHEAMKDALTQDSPIQAYYAFRADQKDGEFLADLVRTCQKTMRLMSSYELIKEPAQELQQLYIDLQTYKHADAEKRDSFLIDWAQNTDFDFDSDLNWYEFSAAAGSTLGVFCLVSYALGDNMKKELANLIVKSYFPYMQVVHILLDYYIDQNEDSFEGDLNFYSYYNDDEHFKSRLNYFMKQADDHVRNLPDNRFHLMIRQGLIGLYLSDPKVRSLDGGKEMTQDLLRMSGYQARFFHWNSRCYYRFKKPGITPGINKY